MSSPNTTPPGVPIPPGQPLYIRSPREVPVPTGHSENESPTRIPSERRTPVNIPSRDHSRVNTPLMGPILWQPSQLTDSAIGRQSLDNITVRQHQSAPFAFSNERVSGPALFAATPVNRNNIPVDTRNQGSPRTIAEGYAALEQQYEQFQSTSEEMNRLRQTILSTFQLMDNRQVVMDNIVNDARAIMTSVNPETQSVNNSVDEPQGTESAPRSQDSHIAVEATPAIVRDTRAVQPEDIAPQHDERLANDIRNLLQEEQDTLIARVRSLPHNSSTWRRPDEDDRSHHQRLVRLARNAIDSEQRAMNGVQPPRLDWRHRQAPAPQEPQRPPLRAPSPTAVPINNGTASASYSRRRSSFRPLMLGSGPQITGHSSPESNEQSAPAPPAQFPGRRRSTQVLFNSPLPRRREETPISPDRNTRSIPSTVKANMEHSDDRVIQMIRYAAAEVANEPEHPVHLSKLGIKVNTPKYSGDSSLAVFESFMTDLLRLLKTYQLFKPDYDKTHIRILGTGLEGAAKEWFNHTVDTNDIHSPQWTFEEVVLALKDRFVHRASSQDAAVQFDQFTQSKRGVMEYYNMLRSYAQRMVEKPSSYDFRRRFLNGLSYGIRHRVLDYGLAPETAEVDSILQLALQVETSSQYTSRNTPTTSRDNTTKSSDGHAASSRSKPQSHTSSRTAPSHNHKHYAQRNVPAKPPHRGSSNSVVRFNPASTQHKSAYNPGSQSARSATPANRGTAFKPKPMDRSTIKCYGCGGFGHMANNCPYPPGKAHAAAGHIMPADDLGNTEDDADERYEDEHFEGNQYMPELDDAEDGFDPVTEVNPDENDPMYDMTDNNPHTDDVVMDPSSHFDDEVEHHVQSHGSMIVPWDEPPAQLYAYSAVTTAEVIPPMVFRHRASRKANPGELPIRPPEGELQTLAGYIEINGVKAHVLIDSGCTTDMISPDFLAAINQVPFELDRPVGLQLATLGSKSKINFGFRASLRLGRFKTTHYLDVANVDKYQLIIGTPFLRQHNAVLDFAKPASLTIHGERHIEGKGEFGAPIEGGRVTAQDTRQKPKLFKAASTRPKDVPKAAAAVAMAGTPDRK